MLPNYLWCCYIKHQRHQWIQGIMLQDTLSHTATAQNHTQKVMRPTREGECGYEMYTSKFADRCRHAFT